MTWPRYTAICALWRDTPPLSVSAAAIAARLGAIELRAAKQDDRRAQRQELLEQAGGLGMGSGLPDWLIAARAAERAARAAKEAGGG